MWQRIFNIVAKWLHKSRMKIGKCSEHKKTLSNHFLCLIRAISFEGPCITPSPSRHIPVAVCLKSRHTFPLRCKEVFVCITGAREVRGAEQARINMRHFSSVSVLLKNLWRKYYHLKSLLWYAIESLHAFFDIKPKLSNIAVFMVIFGEEALPYPWKCSLNPSLTEDSMR